MKAKRITLDIVCPACGGTGLYVGMGEGNSAAVVCHTCKGTGKSTYSYEPFVERKPIPNGVTSVHVGRGYNLGDPSREGGLPIAQWQPGATVPADESYYCPYSYTSQGWCAKPEPTPWSTELEAPIRGGVYISDCKHWATKAECWAIFHANAPESARRQVS